MHRNVAKLVRPPHLARDEVRVLTVEEARLLVGGIRGDRFEALWSVPRPPAVVIDGGLIAW